MGTQRVGHDWATELNWSFVNCFSVRVLRLFNRQRTVSLTNGTTHNWIATCKRMKLDPYFIPYTNTTKIKKLNVRAEWWNRRKHRGKSLYPQFWQTIPNYDTKTINNKTKYDLNLIKIKNFYVLKYIIKKSEKTTFRMGGILANICLTRD